MLVIDCSDALLPRGDLLAYLITTNKLSPSVLTSGPVYFSRMDVFMENLVKFPLGGDEFVAVQVNRAVSDGPLPAANKPGMMQQAQMGFAEAAGKLRPIAHVLLEQLKDLEADELKLEFAVGFSAEAGMILAKSGAEGHCRLSLIWKQR